MTQDSWQYQGRQGHGWFGHGTAPHADDPPPMRQIGRENPPAPADIAARATYVGYGALGPLDRPLARSWESRLEHGALGHLRTVMVAHPATRHLGNEAYRQQMLDYRLSPEETRHLRRAADLTHAARTLDDLAPASEALARVVHSAGAMRTASALAIAARAEVPPKVEGNTGSLKALSTEARFDPGETAVRSPEAREPAKASSLRRLVAQAGLDISTHALERMQEKMITPNALLDAISNGSRVIQPNGNIRCIGASCTVVLSPTGSVVTVW